MKQSFYLILFLLTFIGCNAQSTETAFTEANFETKFLELKPVRKEGVTEKDFNWAVFVIDETQKSIRDQGGEYNVANYWNIVSAFHRLGEDKAVLEMLFTKVANAEGACEYILQLKDKVSFDDKIPELYDQYYQSCAGKSEKVEDFDLQTYIQKERLDKDLVHAIYRIDIKDQKYRDADDATFTSQQPPLDKANQKSVDSLFKIHKTYIGKSLVGEKFAHIMWSVIQHSNLEMMGNYLPLVHQAVLDGELHKTPLKMLIDRYYGLKHGYQVFGTQQGFNFEMADEATRNQIIEQYGLE